MALMVVVEAGDVVHSLCRAGTKTPDDGDQRLILDWGLMHQSPSCPPVLRSVPL